MSLRYTVIFGSALLIAGQAIGAPAAVVVVPVEHAADVKPAEAVVFYQAVITSLGKVDNIRVVERAKLKLILDELDLAQVLAPDAAGQRYSEAAAQLSADTVVVPGIVKLEHDYLLSLRKISVTNGTTEACEVTKTRLTAKFAECAKVLVERMMGPEAEAATPPKGIPNIELQQLRLEARAAGAERLFPALWKRAETLFEKIGKGEPADLAAYYLALLRHTARASAPPGDMVFVPGGYVTFKTSAGKRQLWVEAFFIDRMEVTVGQYNQFLEALKADPAAGGTKLLPITRRLGMFNKPPLPVTGVTFFAADAYARWSGKRLPTVLEWSHAAAGIKMPKTGYGATGTIAALVPAAAPGLDVSRYGAVAMAGNVREWTATWYAKDIYARAPADAPRGPEDGTLKIVKGGGWRTGPKIANINNYEKHKPAEAFDDIGFRCAVPFFRRPGDGMGRPPENKGLTGPDKEIVQ